MKRYFELFKEHIAPKSNTLIAIMELKRVFQGSLSLKDFHTKALHLVKEAEYYWMRDIVRYMVEIQRMQRAEKKNNKSLLLRSFI